MWWSHNSIAHVDTGLYIFVMSFDSPKDLLNRDQQMLEKTALKHEEIASAKAADAGMERSRQRAVAAAEVATTLQCRCAIAPRG